MTRWWPAVLGIAVAVIGAGVFVALSSLRGDSGSVPVVSVVRYSADLVDVSGAGGATATVAVELNDGDGELCYTIAAPTMVRPLSLSLNANVVSADAGDAGVAIELGAHSSGSLGCATVGRDRTSKVLASPESYYLEMETGDGAVLRGTLVYAPEATEVAAGTETPAQDQEVAAGILNPNKAGFIFPDRESSVRWEEFDSPLIQAACGEAGIECLVDNADGDPARMAAIADEMLAQGVSVLAIAGLDATTTAAIQEKAAAAGVHNIDYDRLTVGGHAEVYVSFDNVAVGAALGEGLLTCLGDAADGARIIQLHGDPGDNNAAMFQQGYQEVLDNSPIETVGDAPIPGWEGPNVAPVFENLLAAAGGEPVDGVLAANDAIGLAVQDILAADGLTLPVTGQDATVEGLRAVLQGSQCMTVYKPLKVEADAVVRAAVALMRGVDPPANTTIDNGNGEIPFVQAQTTSIFFDQVKIPVADGYVNRDELCQGIEDLCQQAGIE